MIGEDEEQQFAVDIQPYLQKRANIMKWLRRYGSQLKISRNAQAAAQLYTDLYFHNSPYSQPTTKTILTSLLILASKHCDYKILYTNHIAYICQLDP